MAAQEKIRDWLGEFLDRHKARYNPHDWPAGEATEEYDVYVRTWHTEFATRHVTKSEADEASARLAANPPNFRREHIPMVVHAIEQIRAERNPQATACGTREAARDASRCCEHCGSEGMATAYHPRPSDEHRVAVTAGATCCCPHGKFIRRIWSETDPGMLRRIPDFDHVLNGASVYVAEPPGHPSIEMSVTEIPMTRSQDRGDGISFALQFLMGALSAKPAPLQKILEGAAEFQISSAAIFEAADKLEVVKSLIDSQEIWDLIQRKNQ
jgi:hypothetical protein